MVYCPLVASCDHPRPVDGVQAMKIPPKAKLTVFSSSSLGLVAFSAFAMASVAVRMWEASEVHCESVDFPSEVGGTRWR